jgi:hypothetical protein
MHTPWEQIPLDFESLSTENIRWLPESQWVNRARSKARILTSKLINQRNYREYKEIVTIDNKKYSFKVTKKTPWEWFYEIRCTEIKSNDKKWETLVFEINISHNIDISDPYEWKDEKLRSVRNLRFKSIDKTDRYKWWARYRHSDWKYIVHFWYFKYIFGSEIHEIFLNQLKLALVHLSYWENKSNI